MTSRYGYKVIYGGRVYAARTLNDAARRLVEARDLGVTDVRVRECVSLTTDQPLDAATEASMLELASMFALANAAPEEANA